MNKKVVLFLIVIAAVVIAIFSLILLQEPEEPRDIVKAYINEMNEGNIAEAKQYLHLGFKAEVGIISEEELEEYMKLIGEEMDEEMEEEMKLMEERSEKVEKSMALAMEKTNIGVVDITKEEIENNRATVEVELMISSEEGEIKGVEGFYLIKDNGEWKIISEPFWGAMLMGMAQY